jgi:Mg-chelatase subunit ChlD
MTAGLRELSLVVLTDGLPEVGLRAGDVGTVVAVYGVGTAYEVEFVTVDGRTIAVKTLRADQIESLSGAQILHVRWLDEG